MKRDILFLERCLDLLNSKGRMAIVLPQGNLNNLGTRSLREWLIGRARLLAIVGLHVNTFKPYTGTKTSVVFLQKWGEIPPSNDYEVFMATSQKSGKTNSGDYKFKTNSENVVIDEDGIPVTQSGKPPAIDHDLDEIANAFVKWASDQGLSFSSEG
jgi:type I restriction enzyme M protein